MKAMPLLISDTLTLKIPDTFEVSLAINCIALRKLNVNSIISYRHWMGMSGGFMVSIGKRERYI